MGDMLFNMVPGSRTKPAVAEAPVLLSYSCAAIGLIFMGLVPYTGWLFTAAVKHAQLNCFQSNF